MYSTIVYININYTSTPPYTFMMCRRHLRTGTLFCVSNIVWHFQLAHLLYKLQLLNGQLTYTCWSSGRKWQMILTKLIEQSPSSKADSSLASHETPQILCNTNVCCCVDNSSPHVRVLNQINSVYLLPSHFFKIDFNITIPSTLMSSKWFFSSSST
jgi:hypothetical protein